MVEIPFRFLHSGDFRLGEPAAVAGEVPSVLEDVLLEAPYRAVEQVVDTALNENVSFVVLVGEVIDPQQGSTRAVPFFLAQLERLAKRDITVYWSSPGASHWPAAIPLPENVISFADREIEAISHLDRNGQAIATLLGGASQNQKPQLADIRACLNSMESNKGLPTIALTNGEADPKALAQLPIGYWALGGKSTAQTLFQGEHSAHYAGSPQGRSKNDAAAHSCTLVDVDYQGVSHLKKVMTDSVQWRQEAIEVNADCSLKDLEQQLIQEEKRLQNQTGSRNWVVTWEVHGSNALARQLEDPQAVNNLISRLHRVRKNERRNLWTVSIEPALSAASAESYLQEDTILGEYLRTIRAISNNPDKNLPLTFTNSEDEAELSLAKSLSGETNEDELTEAAAMGIHLLRGEKVEEVVQAG